MRRPLPAPCTMTSPKASMRCVRRFCARTSDSFARWGGII
jgi:hypothetical protein